jgi:hypothetical protein
MRVAISVVLLLSLTSLAQAAAPSVADAQADFAAGQYRDALQKISVLLAGKSAPPGSQERFDLLMLRGECMLRLKQSSLAADAFDAAARARRQQGDVKRLAEAKATAVLLSASRGLKFQPRGGGGGGGAEAIDVVAPEARRQAMAALLDERLAELTPRAAAAVEGTSLTPMMELLPAFADAYALELTATGDATRVTPMLISRRSARPSRQTSATRRTQSPTLSCTKAPIASSG